MVQPRIPRKEVLTGEVRGRPRRWSLSRKLVMQVELRIYQLELTELFRSNPHWTATEVVYWRDATAADQDALDRLKGR